MLVIAATRHFGGEISNQQMESKMKKMGRQTEMVQEEGD